MIERRSPGTMNTPVFLAHGDYPRACQLRGCEMDVTQLCKSVANGVIDCTLANLSAFNMRYWNPQCQGDRSGGQHFVTVRRHQQQVGSHLAEAIRQTQCRQTDR